MVISVIGTGNVGSALLVHITEVDGIDKVLVMNLQEEWSKAAIMDAASARPASSGRLFECSSFEDLNRADLVFLTSGVQMGKHETGEDVLNANFEITRSILGHAPLKPTCIVVCLATPVDQLTPYVQSLTSVSHQQVMGFGGDLDRNRLEYVLRQRRIDKPARGVVGEHGKNIIPVYDGEEFFNEVAHEVGHFLASITAQGGSPRNLATGYLMAELADCIVNDRRDVHHVCGFHPGLGTYLTWPFIVGLGGLIEPLSLDLPPKAKEALKRLLGIDDFEL